MPDPQDDLYAEAVRRFQELLERARETSVREPMAMTLATADSTGVPAARIVLLRGFDARGFVFYTNTGSAKAGHLADNPRAALCFHWDELDIQVRAEGMVQQVTDMEADAYWAGRPWDSQIGAWASRQSQPLVDRNQLERAIQDCERRFAGQDVPRPEFWAGFRVVPFRIEFWNRQPARLHDRLVYNRQDDGPWTKGTVYP